jgi:hypothetical protein
MAKNNKKRDEKWGKFETELISELRKARQDGLVADSFDEIEEIADEVGKISGAELNHAQHCCSAPLIAATTDLMCRVVRICPKQDMHPTRGHSVDNHSQIRHNGKQYDGVLQISFQNRFSECVT